MVDGSKGGWEFGLVEVVSGGGGGGGGRGGGSGWGQQVDSPPTWPQVACPNCIMKHGPSHLLGCTACKMDSSACHQASSVLYNSGPFYVATNWIDYVIGAQNGPAAIVKLPAIPQIPLCPYCQQGKGQRS